MAPVVSNVVGRLPCGGVVPEVLPWRVFYHPTSHSDARNPFPRQWRCLRSDERATNYSQQVWDNAAWRLLLFSSDSPAQRFKALTRRGSAAARTYAQRLGAEGFQDWNNANIHGRVCSSAGSHGVTQNHHGVPPVSRISVLATAAANAASKTSLDRMTRLWVAPTGAATVAAAAAAGAAEVPSPAAPRVRPLIERGAATVATESDTPCGPCGPCGSPAEL